MNEATSSTAIGATSLVILQPTPFCNIECAYCYLPERRNRATLSQENIRKIFEKLMTFPTVRGQTTVVWHAGEPLVLGPDYYAEAFAAIREICAPALDVHHAFQTNGMLIDEAWCALFKAWNVSIGLSIDGPEHIHDAARKTRAGKGTFAAAMKGIAHLQANGIPFHIISVLTRAAMAEPEALFDLYREIGAREVGFNIEEEEGRHAHSTLRECESNSPAVTFFKRFTARMKETGHRISVRELDETMTSIRYFDRSGPTNNLVLPFGILTIDVHGNVYPYSPELAGYKGGGFDTFAIGNILTDSYGALAASEVMRSITTQIAAGVELCRATCGYFSVCGGGSPSNKVFENGSFASGETLYCKLMKKQVTDFLLEEIETGEAARYHRPAHSDLLCSS